MAVTSKTGRTMRKCLPELEMVLVDRLPSFSCRLCARCCHAKLIPVYQRDIERLGAIADYAEVTTAAEAKLTGAQYKMKMIGGRCILLSDGRCSKYEKRPDTCRRHPFIATGRNLLVSSTCIGVDWSGTQDSGWCIELSQGIAHSLDSYLELRRSRRLKSF